MLIEKFIEYLQIEKKYSVNTLHAYKKDLAEFQEFIYENYDKYVTVSYTHLTLPTKA